MDFLSAVLLGIVEGITEFLPISSTGHLVLASRFLGLETTEFSKTFDIAIQLGAILAILALYWKSLLVNKKIITRVALAFVPTAVLGLLLYDFVRNSLLGNEIVSVAALALGGLFLIIFELMHNEDQASVDQMENITYKQSVAIGLFQAIAFIPGVSRAAATIIGGLMMGMRRKTIVEFSFLLAVPTMVAATGLDLFQTASSFAIREFQLLAVGFVVSFVVALISVKLLLRFIENHTFISFGVYRILLAAAFLIFIL